MTFRELIKTRESIRSYDENRPVPKEILLKIADAGRLAPSANNRQPWSFIIVSSREMLEKVRPCYQKVWFQKAPHILIVKGSPSKAWVRNYDGYNSLEADLSIAMTHIILAAEAEGVGACWIAAFDPYILRKALELKGDEIPYCLTPLGYPEKGYVRPGNKKRKSLEEVTFFI
jgi:nitroreductase